ncbi:ABC transporter ATP-binding protein [Ferrovibrio sp.]|uniref:ABC transporter ATP-binding protein n=1 Tax=Ferrovibrio sp. TaxID=1917215 RepID=UPI000CBE2509|nr:ABC transporter ATP-binding protein [Ferrovibrio sp.]PJI42186.1 MAG: ABC transporter ATP-binding protein [Ferrovibrio sp.]
MIEGSGASIEFRGIGKRYGETVALADLDLTIQPGEFVSLLGPSGSGKTTTLNILAGLISADSGSIMIGDTDVTYLSPDRRGIAMVFQNYALYPHMTIAENLAFPLQARGRNLSRLAIKAKVQDVADTLGIGHLLARYPKEISGGQQQRVALGRAMVRDPKVFLLDEPLSNLDARLRLKMRRDLKALHQRLRSTIVYVTHDQSEAMSLSDRIAIYQGGRLQQCGTPADIYRRPANAFVANFMGEREMNNLPGTVVQTGGGVVFKAEGLDLTLPSTLSGWARFHDRAVTLGIRPQGVQIGQRADATQCEAVLRLVEHAGTEQFFYAQAGGVELSGAAAPDTPLAIGDRVSLTLLSRELYLFDTASGAALVQGGDLAA